MWRLNWQQVFKHFAFALVTGVVCALASVVLCLCVQGTFWLFKQNWLLVWLLPIIGLAELALYKELDLPLDLSTRHVIKLMRNDKQISHKLAPGILLGTCMSMLCGGSVGKEAGALQMGASLGSLIARPFKLKSVYVKNKDESMAGYVSAAAMAATFSALFFAPLGSAMLVMELSRFKKSINKHIVSILLACFTSCVLARFIGIGDIVTSPQVPPLDWICVGECIIIGVACALGGALFASAIDWTHDLTWRINKNFYVWVVVGGLTFATLVSIFGWQNFCGSGGDILNAALAGSYAPADFAIKALLTLLCLGFWFKGGEIMPSLCIGALLGAACSVMTGGEPIFGATVGTVAFFAAFSRCPFAAFLLGCEIFGWTAAPALAIAIAVAFMFGSPIGAYGEGIDRALRTRWHSIKRHVNSNMHDKAEPYAIGAISHAEDVIEGIEATLNSTENKTAKESRDDNDSKSIQ
jgi:H+/Cl- antiporter ClcA